MTTGTGQMIGVRLQADDLELLDLWIKANDATLSRPEALRRILRMVAVRVPKMIASEDLPPSAP